jgi:hypothetical protein
LRQHYIGAALCQAWTQSATISVSAFKIHFTLELDAREREREKMLKERGSVGKNFFLLLENFIGPEKCPLMIVNLLVLFTLKNTSQQNLFLIH